MVDRSSFINRAAMIFVIVTLCIIAGCISSQAPPSTNLPGVKDPLTMNTQPMPTFSGVAPVPTLSEKNEVKMQGNDFEPRTLVVMNGTTVTWTNDDENRNYSVVSDTGAPAAFQSGALSKGGIFTFRFAQPGTYPYHSAIPPEITGRIVVL